MSVFAHITCCGSLHAEFSLMSGLIDHVSMDDEAYMASGL